MATTHEVDRTRSRGSLHRRVRPWHELVEKFPEMLINFMAASAIYAPQVVAVGAISRARSSSSKQVNNEVSVHPWIAAHPM
jgi:hypothetical protein